MEKGLFFLIEAEGELAEEVLRADTGDIGPFFKSESARLLEISEILRSLGRRADFAFAEQAYYELESELKNARKLLRSMDRSPPEILGRRLEAASEKLEAKISAQIADPALSAKRTNLATAHLRATPEREFLRGLEERIEQDASELEKILAALSPLIKQAYLPPLANSIEKTLKKQQGALARIIEGANPEKNRGTFMDRAQEALMELKTTNGKLLPFLEKANESLELLEKALFCWAHLHALLLKCEQDRNSLNKGIEQVLEGAGFNSIPQLARRLPDAEKPQMPIVAKQATFLKNRILEVNGLLSDAQWKLYAKAGRPEPKGAEAAGGPEKGTAGRPKNCSKERTPQPRSGEKGTSG